MEKETQYESFMGSVGLQPFEAASLSRWQTINSHRFLNFCFTCNYWLVAVVNLLDS